MAEKDSNLSKWQKEFFENIHIFEQFGMSKEEAIKLVTINPAKQLKVDQYTGSLEAGKEADFAALLELQARASKLDLKPEDVEVGTGL